MSQPPDSTSHSDFPSGEWTGFFLERHQPNRGWMHLYMSFENGTIQGEGTDYVGPWHILGSYDEQTRAASWIKQYLGKHKVEYNGQGGEQGIRGAWNINGFSTGHFHIWPKAMRNIDAYYIENEIDIDGSQLLNPVPIDDTQLIQEHLPSETPT